MSSYDSSPGSYCSDKLFVAHSRNISDWAVDGPAFEISKLDWEITDDEWQALEKEWDARRVKIDWLRLSDYLDSY